MSANNTISIRLEVQGDATTLSKITNVLNGFKGLKGGIEQARSSMQQQWSTGGLTGLGAAMGQAQTQAVTLKTRLTEIGGALASNASAFGVATASVWGVYNAYDSLVKVEIRAETAMNRVSTMTTTLATLENRLTEARNTGNMSAEDMAILEERITNTKAKLATAQERSADLQGDVNEAWGAFASQVGPQVVAAGGSIAQLVTNMRGSLTGIVPKIKDFISNLSLTGGGAKSLAAGVSPLVSILPSVGGGAHAAAGGIRAMSTAVKGLLIGTGIGAVVVILGLLTEGFGLLSDASAKSTQDVQGNIDTTTGEVGRYSEEFQSAYDRASKAIEEHAETVKKKHDAISSTIRAATITDATTALNASRQRFLAAKGESDAVTAKILSLRKQMENAGSMSSVYATVIQELTKEETRLIAITESKRLTYQAEGKALGVLTDAAVAQNQTVKDTISINSQAAASSEQHALAIEKTHDAVRRSVDMFINDLTPAVQQGLITEEAFAAAFATSSASYADFSDLKTVANEHFQKSLEKLFPDLEDQEKIKKKLAEINGTLISTEDELALKYAEFKIQSDEAMRTLKGEVTVKAEQVKAENDLIQSMFAGIDVKNLNIEQTDSLTQLVTKLTTQYEAEEISLLELAHTYGIATTEIEKLIANQENNVDQIKKIITANIDYARALTDTKVNTKLVEEGHFKATIAVHDFLAELVRGQAETERTNLLLREVATETLGMELPKGIKLTNDELKRLIEAEKLTGEGALELEKIMQQRLAPALEKFTGILGATSWKEFKDAWKELKEGGDLKGVPDKLKSSIKDIGQDLIDVNKNAREASNTIAALMLNVQFDRSKGNKSGVKELKEDLEDMPGSDKLQPVIDWLDDVHEMSGDDRRQALSDYSDTLLELLAAMDPEGPGGRLILPGERDTILKTLGEDAAEAGDELDGATTSMEDNTEASKDLTDEQKKLRENFILAGTIKIVTDQLNLQGRAVRGLTLDWGNLVKIANQYPGMGGGGNGKGGFTNVSTITEEDIQDPNKDRERLEEINKIREARGLGPLSSTDDTQQMIDQQTDLQVALQKTQTALANLANQGANSLNILAKASSSAVNGIKNNLKVGEVAAQHMQTGLANLSNQGTRSLAALASASSKAMQGTRNNLNVGYVAAGHLQTGLANLANQGARSLAKLASASSSQMNGFVNNLKKGQTAVENLQSAISNLKSKTVHIGLTGPGVKFLAHGFHGVVDKPTLMVVGEAGAEKVDVSPITGGKATGLQFENTRNVKVEPVGKLDTSPRFERETIREKRGPSTIQIVTYQYLYPGSNEFRKSIQQVSLDNTGSFPTA